MHNTVLHNCCSSDAVNHIAENEVDGTCVMFWGRTETCGFVGESRSKEITRGSRRRCEGGIDVEETGCEGVYWIYLAQGSETWRACVNTVMYLKWSMTVR